MTENQIEQALKLLAKLYMESKGIAEAEVSVERKAKDETT